MLRNWGLLVYWTGTGAAKGTARNDMLIGCTRQATMQQPCLPERGGCVGRPGPGQGRSDRFGGCCQVCVRGGGIGLRLVASISESACNWEDGHDGWALFYLAAGGCCRADTVMLCWRNLAESVRQYLGKGWQVYV